MDNDLKELLVWIVKNHDDNLTSDIGFSEMVIAGKVKELKTTESINYSKICLIERKAEKEQVEKILKFLEGL